MSPQTALSFKLKLINLAKDIIGDSRLVLTESKIDDVMVQYHRYNKMLKESMSNAETRIDAHKIAACFLFSILKIKPMGISFTNENKSPDSFPTFKERTANESLGFVFGIYLMELFSKNTADTVEEKFIATKDLQLPICNENIKYSHHFIQLISGCTTDIDEKEFNVHSVFIFSHIFFLIEAYSYQYWLSFFKKENAEFSP